MFYSECVNNEYQVPVNIGTSINSSSHESTPYIDQEGKFIMFFRSGIWISRRNTDGTWAVAERISDVYPEVMGPCAKLTPDGLHLFFMKYVGGQNNIYWVDAQVINEFLTSTEEEHYKGKVFPNFNLYQNYPNPFNPTTTIEYSIASRSFVTLKIYDVLGNEIATLVNEEKPAGEYEIEFNGEGISSGIYFYRLQTNKYVGSKKMIYIK